MWAAFEENLWKLGNLAEIWGAADVAGKQRILRLLFGPFIEWGDVGFRTREVPIIGDVKTLAMNGLYVIEDGISEVENDGNPAGARNGMILEPLIRLLAALAA